jgi:hypothetical protein
VWWLVVFYGQRVLICELWDEGKSQLYHPDELLHFHVKIVDMQVKVSFIK